MVSSVRITDATLEPVSIAQAKAQCRIDGDADDVLLAGYITAARQHVENRTGRALLTQTWRTSLDRFPAAGFSYSPDQLAAANMAFAYGGMLALLRQASIQLPRVPVASITSVTYLDLQAQRQELDADAYLVDKDSAPARLTAAPGTWFPFSLITPGSVQVTYTAGYGDTVAKVPATLTLAIQLLIGHWYENREASVLPASGTGVVSIPLGFEELIAPYIVPIFDLEAS